MAIYLFYLLTFSYQARFDGVGFQAAIPANILMTSLALVPQMCQGFN